MYYKVTMIDRLDDSVYGEKLYTEGEIMRKDGSIPLRQLAKWAKEEPGSSFANESYGIQYVVRFVGEE